MILPIYVYGQPVLRKVAEDITPDYPNLKELIANMFETMVHADGVGLAAPQIGLPIRVVTITLDPLSEDYPEFKDFNKAYINPHIIEVGGEEVSMEEGCLSLPGKYGIVTRPEHVVVRAQDRNGDWYEYEGDEILARCFLHEIDHLDGHMYTEIAEKMLTPEELAALEQQEADNEEDEG